MVDIKQDSWVHELSTGLTSSTGLMYPQDSVVEGDQIEQTKQPMKSIGELIIDFVHLRDTLKEERKIFKLREKEIEDAMELLEAQMLQKQRELQVTSLSTEHLTAYQYEKTSVRMGNWETFSEWVLRTGNIQCVEKRCAKLACLEIEEDLKRQAEEKPEEAKTMADLGIDVNRETCIAVRKK